MSKLFWKIVKFLLFVIFVTFAFNLAKSPEGELFQFLVLLVAIVVGYYFFYFLPEREKEEDSDYDENP